MSMRENQMHALFGPDGKIPAVRKNRKNDTCNMRAWYYQTENNTYAFAILRGIHGVRPDIKATRRYFGCEGNAIFSINGKDITVGKGSIIEIPAGATYDFRSIGNRAFVFYVDVGLRLDLDAIPSK